MRSVIATLGEAVVTTDSAQRIIFFNDAAVRLFGYRPEEVLGEPLEVLIPERHRGAHPGFVEGFDRAPETARLMGARGKIAGRRKDGSEFPAEASISKAKIGEKRYMTAVLRDITERERVALALRASEERYALAIAGTNEGIWDWEISSGRVFQSPRLLEILGLPAEKSLTDGLWKLAQVHPGDVERFRAAMGGYFRGLDRFYECEYRIRRADGAWRWMRDRGIGQRDAHARVHRMVGSIADITREKEDQAELNTSRTTARRSLEMQTAILDALPANVALLDGDGTIAAVNGSWRDFARTNRYGVPEAGLGRNYLDICEQAVGPDAELARAAGKGIRCVLTHETDGFDLEYPCHSPEAERWFSLRVAPVPGRADVGVGVGVVVMHTDITKHRKAEFAIAASEARFRRLAENVPGELFTRVMRASGELEYTYLSPGYERRYGIVPTSARTDASALVDGMHPDDRERFMRSIRASARDLSPWREELRVQRKSGGYYWVLSQATPYRLDDGSVAWDGIIVDVTAAKENEAALRKALQEAHQASQAKTAFLGHMSHELRTPLNAIIGFSELLLARVGGALEPKQQGYVDDILSSGRHLLDLISALLEVARIERGGDAIVENVIDLHALGDAALGMVEGAARGAAVRFINRVPEDFPRFRGDSRAMSQIFVNLLANAIRYTPKGGQIAIGATATDDGGATLSVSDTGTGMTPEQVERLNQPLQEIDARKVLSSEQGLGIGFEIVRQLVELHGGRVRVTSELNVGTSIMISLPSDRFLRNSGK